MTSPDNNGYLKFWERIKSAPLFTSKRLNVRQDTCRLPSNRIVDDYLVVEVPDGAVIIAITEKKEIVLVQQYKHGLGEIVLELPAGNVEEGEEAATTIARELTEETGFIAREVEFISVLATKPARMSARTFVYYAAEVINTGTKKNTDMEVIQMVLVPLKELPALIQQGKIITETSLAALLLVWHRIMA